jgi:hypothetical protein
MAPPNVVSLGSRRRRAPRLVAAAAAVLAVVFLGLAVAQLGGDGSNDQDASTSADSSATTMMESELAPSASESQAGGADPNAATTAAADAAFAARVEALPGSYADAEDVFAAVRRQIDPSRAGAPTAEDDSATGDGGGDEDGDDAGGDALPDPADPQQSQARLDSCRPAGVERAFTAVLDGATVLVVVDAESIAIVGDPGCTRVASVPRG